MEILKELITKSVDAIKKNTLQIIDCHSSLFHYRKILKEPVAKPLSPLIKNLQTTPADFKSVPVKFKPTALDFHFKGSDLNLEPLKWTIFFMKTA